MKLEVLHLGNDVRGPGGIAAVIRGHMARTSVNASATPTYDSRGKNPFARSAPALSAAFRLLKTPTSTVIHAHLSNKGSLLREGALVLLARLTRHVVVVTLHGSGMATASGLEKSLLRFVCARSDVVHILSRSYKGISGTARERVLPNDVRLGDPLPLEERSAKILFVGEVGNRKGVDVLVALADSLPEVFELELIGPMSRSTSPDLQKALRSSSRILYRGPLDTEQTRRRIAEAFILVNPSRGEAFPMVVCEALASGTPVVGTRVGGQGALLEDSGQIVQPLDASAFEDEVRKLKSDAGAWKLRSRVGYSFAQQSLDFDVVSGEWALLYTDALRERRGA